MDMRDKQFDTWMKNALNSEMPLSKQNRQAAWEQIRLTASQPTNTIVVEDEFAHITAPIVICEALHTRIWNWVSYFVTQESTYQKAHANSVQYYKATPNYRGGLTLHNLELMRHRWACAV